MTNGTIEKHRIVSQDEWLEARKKLLRVEGRSNHHSKYGILIALTRWWLFRPFNAQSRLMSHNN